MKKYNLVKRFSFLFATFMNLGLPVNGMLNVSFSNSVNSESGSHFLGNTICMQNVQLLKSFLKGKENVFIVPIDANKSYGVVVKYIGSIEITKEDHETDTTDIFYYVSETSSGGAEWEILSFDEDKAIPLEFDMTLINDDLKLPVADENIQTFVRSCFKCDKTDELNSLSYHHMYGNDSACSYNSNETPCMLFPFPKDK